VELAFVEKALRDLCASGARLDRRLGADRAETLRARLADFRAVSSIHELVVQVPRAIDESGLMALDVAEGVRIIFSPNHRKVPVDEAGRVDWSHVSRLRIVRIEGAND
jgi:hypothetical protein